MKSTNYYNTFIEVAEDCPASQAEVPPQKTDKLTVAKIQYNLISKNPYKFTSDDVLFQVFAQKNNISNDDFETEKKKFFSKGQPCFRSSPLTKRYGWGVHSDGEGRIALIAMDSDEYQKLSNNKELKVLKAMRQKRT
jgi:hypothetical protein